MSKDKGPETGASRAEGNVLKVNEGDARTVYANVCLVHGTPEEVVLNFGVAFNPAHEGEMDMRLQSRVVLNYYTTKRLAVMLSRTLTQYEATYGALELDPRRRRKAGTAVENLTE